MMLGVREGTEGKHVPDLASAIPQANDTGTEGIDEGAAGEVKGLLGRIRVARTKGAGLRLVVAGVRPLSLLSAAAWALMSSTMVGQGEPPRGDVKMALQLEATRPDKRIIVRTSRP
jgi:hypothetical protein